MNVCNRSTPGVNTDIESDTFDAADTGIVTRVDAVKKDIDVPLSIYDIRSSSARWRILLIAAFISILTPVTDTIILPALVAIRDDLPGSTPDTDAALVSVYMGSVGLCNLGWGPASDYFGRRRPLFLSLILFLAATPGCLFAPTASTLLAARAAQGCVVGATIAVTQAIVADTFAPHERGTALGLFFVPLLIGPILAPVIGGALTASFDWRSIFSFLAVAGAFVFMLVLQLPETHHYYSLKAWRNNVNNRECVVIEESNIQIPLGSACVPWAPLFHLVDRELTPFILLAAVQFACMFVTLTTLPSLCASPPLSLPPAIIGATFLPIGFAMLLGSVMGGRASDRAAAAHPDRLSARLIPSLRGASLMIPGLIGFGISAKIQSLSGILISHVLVGLGQSIYQPGFFAFISSARQSQAAAVAASAMAASFAAAGIAISAAPPIAAAVAYDGLFYILAACTLISLVIASFSLLRFSTNNKT